MRVLKVGEFGKTLFFNSNADISGATSHTVEFVKPSGQQITRDAILGTQDITGCDIYGTEVTFLANQYTSYTIQSGDLDEDGCWMYRSLNPSASFNVPGDWREFKVVP